MTHEDYFIHFKKFNILHFFRRGKTPVRNGRTPSKLISKEAVEVVCRIRPLENSIDNACVERISDTTVQLNSGVDNTNTATQHTFKQVFDFDKGQKEVFTDVALPLCRNLLQVRLQG